MPDLRFKFRVYLHPSAISDPSQPHGPLFYRWLPNGKEDALRLSADGAQTQITIWFERRAREVSGFLSWDQNAGDFDAKIMVRQCKLEAGLLFGEMITTVSDAEFTALTRHPVTLDQPFGQHDPDDETYVSLGKRVVGELQRRVGNFITVLRSQFGQYWLQELHPWDSRRLSLGSYCSSVFGLTLQVDEASPRDRVLPTRSEMRITAGGRPTARGYAEYLTEDDWRKLQRDRCSEGVPVGMQLLGQATQALGWGEWAQAYVYAISALEIALATRIHVGKEHAKAQSALSSFHDRQPLPARAAVVLLALGTSADAIEAVLAAIRIRNDVVHEGYK